MKHIGIITGVIVGLGLFMLYILNMLLFSYLIPYIFLLIAIIGILSWIPISIIAIGTIFLILSEYIIMNEIGNYIDKIIEKYIEKEEK